MVSDSAILKKIERQPKRSAGFKQLLREMGLHGAERRELSDRLERLVADGQLVRIDSDRYALPQAAANKNVVIGRLTMHRDGYGFVIPDPTSLDERLKSRIAGDIFIPPAVVGSAMHGDRVLVEVGAIKSDGRAEGRILRTVDRAHATVVGTFHYGSRHNYVTPMDQKISQEIIIPPGMEIAENAKSSASPVSPVVAPKTDQPQRKTGAPRSADRVLGREAARPARWDDLEGVVVDVEITDWPTVSQNARGRVTEILGYPDDFGVDVEIMIRKFHLPHHFPPAVLEDARNAEATIPSSELRRRRDFRGLPIVTIDGETARDFDDAVLVRAPRERQLRITSPHCRRSPLRNA